MATGKQKNEPFGIQDFPRIKKILKFLRPEVYNIETTENFSVCSVVPFLPLFSKNF